MIRYKIEGPLKRFKLCLSSSYVKSELNSKLKNQQQL